MERGQGHMHRYCHIHMECLDAEMHPKVHKSTRRSWQQAVQMATFRMGYEELSRSLPGRENEDEGAPGKIQHR